jgi:hypothetical protein
VAMPVWALLALLTALGLIAPIGMGVRGALLPDILPVDAFVAGRSLFRVVSQSGQLVGNAVGGVLVAVVSPRGALLADAATFAGSAAIVRVGTRARRARDRGEGMSLARDSLSGLRRVFANRRVRRLMLLVWLVPTLAVAPEALAAPSVADLGLSPGLTGWWLTALPAGTVVGELVGMWLVSPSWRQRLIAPLAAIGFLPLLAFATHPGIAMALTLLVLAGSCGMWHLGLDAVLFDAAPPALRPRVLAITGTGLMALQGLGFALAGAVAELLPPHVTIAVAGVVGLGVVAVLGSAARAPAPSAD